MAPNNSSQRTAWGANSPTVMLYGCIMWDSDQEITCSQDNQAPAPRPTGKPFVPPCLKDKIIIIWAIHLLLCTQAFTRLSSCFKVNAGGPICSQIFTGSFRHVPLVPRPRYQKLAQVRSCSHCPHHMIVTPGS